MERLKKRLHTDDECKPIHMYNSECTIEGTCVVQCTCLSANTIFLLTIYVHICMFHVHKCMYKLSMYIYSY